jgi:hypothetical protein
MIVFTVKCCAGCDLYRTNTLTPRCKKFNIQSAPYEVCDHFSSTNTLRSRSVDVFTDKVLEDMIEGC